MPHHQVGHPVAAPQLAGPQGVEPLQQGLVVRAGHARGGEHLVEPRQRVPIEQPRVVPVPRREHGHLMISPDDGTTAPFAIAKPQ